MQDGISTPEQAVIIPSKTRETASTFPAERAHAEALRLASEFKNVFKNMPEYKDAIAERYWKQAEGEGSSTDKQVRFALGDKRYAVNIGTNGDDEEHVWIKRRSIEGIRDTDMVGTSSEDMNKNYWQEIIRISADGPNSRFRSPEFGYAGPGDNEVDHNTESALQKVERVLNELKDLLPASAQIISGEVIPSKPVVSSLQPVTQ